jgi:hypothetical protein
MMKEASEEPNQNFLALKESNYSPNVSGLIDDGILSLSTAASIKSKAKSIHNESGLSMGLI